MKTSPRFLVFTVGFCVTYLVLYALKQPTIIYFPNLGEWHFTTPPPRPGIFPSMLWYGWVFAGVAGGLVLALLVPAKIALRAAALAWIAPLVLFLFTLWHEFHYFKLWF
jgi:hypothetical protein